MLKAIRIVTYSNSEHRGLLTFYVLCDVPNVTMDTMHEMGATNLVEHVQQMPMPMIVLCV